MDSVLNGHDATTIIISLLSLIFLFLFLFRFSKVGHGREAPTVSGAWPILGHLPLLSGTQTPHRTLGALADKYGPIFTIKLLLLLNVFGFGAMLLSTLYLSKGAKRLAIIGWICMVFNISVFAAPLFIIRRVIKTRSVEYMPFTLSMFLTINAVMWFFYGLLLRDYYVALPNTLGFVFGIIQMVMYLIYRNATPVALEEPMKSGGHIIDVVKMGTIPSDPNHPATGGAAGKV